MKIIECIDAVVRTNKDKTKSFNCVSIKWKDDTGFTNTYTGYSPIPLVPGKKYEASIGYKQVQSGDRTYKEPYLIDVSDREVKKEA